METRIKLYEKAIQELHEASMEAVEVAYKKEARKTETVLIILTVLISLVLLASQSLV